MADATVCVWMMQRHMYGGVGGVLGRALGAGHAAIRLTTNENNKHYITWTAQGHPFLSPNNTPQFVKQRYDQIGTENFDYETGFESDKDNMPFFLGGSLPDYTIDMPTLDISRDSITYGVAANRIERYWLDRVQNQRRYEFLSKKYNCTGCVTEALRAGGLGCFVEKEKNLFVQDARTLRVWAELGREKLKALNVRQGMIDAVMKMLAAKHTDVLNAGVPSIQEWIRDSDSKVGMFSQRRDQIANLDVLIRNYPNAQTPLSKFTALIKMQSEVYTHFTTKPNSDRKEAVTKLGAHITGALRRLNVSPDAVDDLTDDAYERLMTQLAWNTDGV